MVKLLLTAMRPHQWIKNLFVFAALIFAKKMVFPGKAIIVTIGFLMFCFISSSVYIINDIMDVEEDKRHPVKRNRPIASGKLSKSTAIYAAVVLVLVSLPVAFYLDFNFGIIIALYFLLNLAYSLFLKYKVVIDVIVIALGFVLRVLGGAAVIGVNTSTWLILCTLFASLFFGFCKRRHELAIMEGAGNDYRKVLEEYSPAFLDQMISVVSALTIMSYALYTVSSETVIKFGTSNLIYTVPFVIYGIFRYFYLVYKKELGGNPTRIILKDKSILAVVFLWLITCCYIIYL